MIGVNNGYGAYVPDNLIAGIEQDFLGKGITLAAGSIYPRGSVVGKITRALGAVTHGVNTGNGTLTSPGMGHLTEIGNYQITCTAAAANGGAFSVITPDGLRLADAKVGTPYANDHIAFTLNDGAADFVVGDSFTIPVVAGSGSYCLVDKTAMDGSSDLDGDTDGDMVVVTEDTDATAGDTVAPAWQQGIFNKAAVTFAAGTVADDYASYLQQQFGIYLKDVVPVNNGY